MNFIAPLAGGLAALSIPIFLLYMLRLRRVEMPISSNFLWQHLVRDREANAPWQKLKFSWLLLLQLLILAALVLALMRPFIEVETFSSGRMVVLLDASASMNATDVEGSRFEQAQKIALDLVETLGGEDTMTVIRVAAVPEVLAAASRDQTLLRNAIREATPSNSQADWSAAMTLAAAGGRGVENFQVVILSDGGISGNFPEIAGEIRLVSIGESGENLAITALATREVALTGMQLFAQISNFGAEDAEVIFSLRLDGNTDIYSANRYAIAAGQKADIIINDLPPFLTLEASLTTPSGSNVPDYLDLDNQAFAVNRAAGAGRVLLVTPRNIFLAQIFSSIAGVRLTQSTPEVGIPLNNQYDLYVFDGWLPAELPQGDILIINPPRSLANFFRLEGAVEDINQTRAIQTQADHPVTQYLNFNQINIRRIQKLSGYESWASPLVQAQGGPLLIAGEQNGRQMAILTFALQESDLPLQLAFPILISNLTQWYTPPRAVNIPAQVNPNEAVLFRPLQGNRIQVTAPDGQQTNLTLGELPQVAFAQTKQGGIYAVEVWEDERSLGQEFFAVNLFGAGESRIQPQESVSIGNATLAASTREEKGQRELWEYLALAGLFILLLEWFYYHRTGVRTLVPRITKRPATR